MNVLFAHFNLVFDALSFAGINGFSAVNEKFQMLFTALQAVKIIAYDFTARVGKGVFVFCYCDKYPCVHYIIVYHIFRRKKGAVLCF